MENIDLMGYYVEDWSFENFEFNYVNFHSAQYDIVV